MRKTLALLASAALMGLTLAAHADSVTYTISNGTLKSGGTYTGSLTIDNVLGVVGAGSFTFYDYGNTYVLNPVDYGKYGPYSYTDLADAADSYEADIEVYVQDPANPLLCFQGGAVCVGHSSLFYSTTKGGLSDYLTGGTLMVAASPAAAATPEPSSLILLGTGLLGVAGAARRRFLKA